MAGDWIKMRVNLVTHPKVMAIAEFLSDQPEFQDWSTLSRFIPGYGCSDDKALRSERYAALRVTRYVTVCALLRFWGYANEHARDEFIEFMAVDDIDEVVQIPKFGAALESVGWVSCAEGRVGLDLPDFNKFNAVASDRSSGADRQKRYRERKKQSESVKESDVTRDVTVTPREEKRREEIEVNLSSTDVDEEIGDAESRSGNPIPNCPHQKLIELYAGHLPELPYPTVWEGKKANAMRARWRWVLTAKKRDGGHYATDEASAVAWFDRYFAYVAKSDFLTGRSEKWMACDLGWLMKADNFSKVVSGNYENKGSK